MKVASQEECAQFCSATDGCNAASYYIDAAKYGGNNCWLKTADFEASMETSSCVLPAGAVHDANAVLLFLVDDTCAPPLLHLPPGVSKGYISRDGCLFPCR